MFTEAPNLQNCIKRKTINCEKNFAKLMKLIYERQDLDVSDILNEYYSLPSYDDETFQDFINELYKRPINEK